MFKGLVSFVFGCRHKRTTRPITPVRKGNSLSGETYISCLDCGKRFRYDLATMQVGKPLPPIEQTAVDSFQTSNN